MRCAIAVKPEVKDDGGQGARDDPRHGKRQDAKIPRSALPASPHRQTECRTCCIVIVIGLDEIAQDVLSSKDRHLIEWMSL